MTRKSATPQPAAAAKKASAKGPVKITDSHIARARYKPSSRTEKTVKAADFFAAAKPFPGVVPKEHQMAMDEHMSQAAVWAEAAGSTSFAEGTMFLGYAFLAELAQRPEYRRISETIATEMTREWIELTAVGDEDKTEKIEQLNKEIERLNLRGAFQKIAAQDGFFGRSHLYLDTGQTDDKEELKMPIGGGWDDTSKSKVAKGSLKAVKPIEAVWCYPANYNSNNPFKPDWYRPSTWFVQGTEIHASRFLTFVSREVPDILKPAYSFGGLSLSQMAKPYVDNWLRTRQSVSDLLHSFSVFVLETDMQAALNADGDQFFKRLALFDLIRDNRGVMAVQKDTEKLSNVSAPLSGLEILQAQSQEHMAAVSGIPIVKLLGIQPAGLNADSEGVMRSFYDWIRAQQEHLFRINLHKVIGFVMISLWGEVDEAIIFKFKPLWALDRKGQAEVDKMEADTDVELINAGVLAPIESRLRIASNPDSRYGSLDVDDLPAQPGDDELTGEQPGAGTDDPAAPEQPTEGPDEAGETPPAAAPAAAAKAPVKAAGGKRAAA